MDPKILSRITPKNIALTILGLILTLVLYSFVTGFFTQTLSLSDSSVNMAPPMYMEGGSGAFGDGNLSAKRMAYESVVSNDRNIMPSPPQVPEQTAKIIKNAELALVVDDVDMSAATIDQIRREFGGQVGSVVVRDYGSGRYGDITIWIPSERFDAALERIQKSALRVTSASVTATDVSAQFVDLEARLKNLKVTEAQYVEIMRRSGTIPDVLAVQRELSQTRQTIEQLQGQLNHLSRQVALSSVHVTLTEEVASGFTKDEWRPLSVIKNAFRDTSRDFTRFIDMVLMLLVKLPVFLLKLAFFGVALYGVWRLARLLYRHLRGSSLPVGGGKV